MSAPAKTDVLIVTGASRGIGAACALLAARAGYCVVVNYAEDEAGAAEVVATIEAAGGRALAFRADVSNEADVAALFAHASACGPLAGVVNNAGTTGGSALVANVSRAAIARAFDVNVIGSMLVARSAIAYMARSKGHAGGSIVNVSSIAARLGGAGEWVHYAASKGAIDTFTRGLAREIAPEGIRVNAVAPGLIETSLHAANGLSDRIERLAPGVPLGRAGTAEEVADAILWLLSPAASYVTGTILEVGGGR